MLLAKVSPCCEAFAASLRNPSALVERGAFFAQS